MHGLDDWLRVARTADADELRERILTGYKTGKPFTPYIPTIDLPSAVDWVLDFGCGVGRSFPYLKSIARHVAGFDLKPMIDRCRMLASETIDLLADDWNQVRGRPFDLIVAALVLQHVDPDACREYLLDFARMSPVVYLLTRLQSDFDVNVLALVVETDAFTVQACVEVEHDPQTHQLRSLGHRSIEELARSSGGGHYEVRLHSKRLTSAASG